MKCELTSFRFVIRSVNDQTGRRQILSAVEWAPRLPLRECRIWSVLRCTVAYLLSVCSIASAAAAGICGSLENDFGPHDYRTASQKTRKLVERYHFTQGVETLTKGESTVRIGGDIHYTLRAFPNHHRALTAMIRLAEREKRETPIGAGYTVSCYIERAIEWRPDDVTVRTIAASFYAKRKDKEVALEHLAAARDTAGVNPQVHYNLGLIYFQVGEYEEAVRSARIAYDGGISLPGLREKLKSIKRWPPPSDSSK